MDLRDYMHGGNSCQGRFYLFNSGEIGRRGGVRKKPTTTTESDEKASISQKASAVLELDPLCRCIRRYRDLRCCFELDRSFGVLPDRVAAYVEADSIVALNPNCALALRRRREMDPLVDSGSVNSGATFGSRPSYS